MQHSGAEHYARWRWRKPTSRLNAHQLRAMKFRRMKLLTKVQRCRLHWQLVLLPMKACSSKSDAAGLRALVVRIVVLLKFAPGAALEANRDTAVPSAARRSIRSPGRRWLDYTTGTAGATRRKR